MRRAGPLALLVALAVTAPAHAAFPGKNGKIAFSSNRTDSSQIYTMNPDGTNQVQLTHDGNNYTPVWSPDGTKIVFVSDRDPSLPDCDFFQPLCNTEIYFMNADGTGQTRVTDTIDATENQPTWTPDGRITYHETLFCGSFGCVDYFATVNPDGSGTEIFPDSCPVSAPAWSPDGTRLAYHRFHYDDPCMLDSDGLFNGAANGTDKHRICCDQTQLEQSIDWEPDASTIVFERRICLAPGQCGIAQVATVRPDGSGFTVLRDSKSGGPSWSPDGTKIAYNTNVDGDSEIHVMNRDGSGDVQITNNTFSDVNPDWQPSPEPQRGDYESAAKFCKADRDFLGAEAFGKKYGTNASRANAFGKCVSGG